MPDRMGILERWVEGFDELLNNQNIGELEVPPTEDDGQILPSAYATLWVTKPGMRVINRDT